MKIDHCAYKENQGSTVQILYVRWLCFLNWVERYLNLVGKYCIANSFEFQYALAKFPASEQQLFSARHSGACGKCFAMINTNSVHTGNKFKLKMELGVFLQLLLF